MRLFNRPMAMPRWKYYLFRILDALLSVQFWRIFFKGFFYVFSLFLTMAMFWVAMVLFGEDELKRKSFDYKIKHNATYQKADQLP